MRIIAGGITSMLKVHLTLRTTFRVLTSEETVFLLGIDIGDKALLGLEVERHLGLFILVATHLKHRGSYHLMAHGIHLTRSIDQIAVETHADILAGQVHILVFHLRTTKKEGA